MPKILAPKADTVFRNATPKDKPFLVADGKGLALQVNPDGMKRWIFRYSFGGKERKLTIKEGFYPKMGLSVAREEARVLRDTVARGEDPGEVRKAIRTKVQEDEIAKAVEEAHNAATFEKVAGDWMKVASKSLAPSNAAGIWGRLEKNVFPWIGSKPIADIRPPEVLAPLRKVEERGALESARRILGVCSQIFRFGVASGLLESDPSRDLRGALTKPKEGHFAALTKPEEVTGLLRAVDAYRGSLETRTALSLGILTFVRPGNLRTAEWSEFHDLDTPERAEWRIPGSKMKVNTDRPFVVPMTPQAIRLLEELRPLTGRGRYLFPSARSNERPMSSMAILAALRRMGYTTDEMTGHGVRAMARTITHEVLGFAPEVIEEQLAHRKSGPLGGAYDRTTHMPERRRLMREWADYLDGLK
jgi:integrase